ncbi:MULTISPECIES: hypothetical protein [unclassified Paraburkholderia]|uniref:hypothetical protein n=1 Tax=unclassified Paraburkholderia TaxID=2615204 RepID=UPI002AB73F6D|nr:MULTISPECIES: hypothetical protein [unclassified Paraburkholderia]
MALLEGASLTRLMSAMVVLDSAQSLRDTGSVDNDDIDRLKHSGSRFPAGASLERASRRQAGTPPPVAA